MILAIYGSGGLGHEILDLAKRINKVSHKWDNFYFINDFTNEKLISNTEVFKYDYIKNNEDLEFIVAVGEPSNREKLFNKLKNDNKNLATLIDPTSIISPSACISEGTVVCEFVSIHSKVKIGKNCLIQPYSLIGHDIIIGNNSVLSTMFAPGGNSTIGNNVYIGMQSTLKENLKIEDGAIISMGSVVMQDIESKETVFGNPARKTISNPNRKIFNK